MLVSLYFHKAPQVTINRVDSLKEQTYQIDNCMRRPVDFLPNTESNAGTEGIATFGNQATQTMHAKDVPDATIQPFKAWHPPRMKTGLRNHPIGRKIEIA
jgi:hypothetical protein